MNGMFYQASFNEDIGTKVVSVNGITYTAWDTLNVTNMGAMFLQNTQFNSSKLVIGIHLNLLTACFFRQVSMKILEQM
jgi:hypothetical protein